MNIKIAIIDTGIDKITAERSICNVNHFSVSKNKIIEKYKIPTQEHGTLCFKEILKQNIDFDIEDINIVDENNELKIENVLLGIKKAIKLKVDIVNISLGFTKYLPELFDICQQAISNNILIISAVSHTNEISYPSDLKNVVGIDVNQNQREIVKKINASTLSLKMVDKIFFENGIKYDFSSTSMASAYFSGLFAKQLEKNPILDKFIVLKKLYDLKINSELDYIDELEYDKMPLYKKIENKRIAIIVLPKAEGNRVDCHLKLNNIVAIYNHDDKKFYSFDGKKTSNFDTILIINSSQYELSVSDNLITHFNDYELIFIGKFKNLKNSLIYKHENFNNETLSALNRPLVLITGISWSLDKFNIQKSLIKNFVNDKFSVKSVTYNAQGSIYGCDIFEYPEKIVFPDIVCSINNYMCCVEANNEIDLWLVNVGGGMFVNNFNKFSFGKLTEAYFHASDVDVLIFCIPTFVDFDQLELNVKKAETYGIKKILFVVSPNTFEWSTIKSLDAIKTYCVDEEKYLNSVKYLRENFNQDIFTYKDVLDKLLYKRIIDILS